MIPKIVHVSWKNKNVLEDEHPMIQMGISNFCRLNTEFKVILSTDEEVDVYLKENLSRKNYENVKSIHIVQKTDIWRLIKIYNEGGMYVDLDRFCNKNIQHHFTEDTKWILPICNNFDFSHDMMISDSNNPVYEYTINLYLNRLASGIKNIYYLGTQTYMHSITYSLFGKETDINPGKNFFDNVRRQLSEISFIKLIDENPPYDTFLYQSQDEESFDHEAVKRDFYARSNTKHWTGEW